MFKRTALITGINGFLGSHLVKVLQYQLPDVRILGIDRSGNVDNLKTFKVDLLDKTAIKNVIKDTRPSYIFHLSGVIYSDNFTELYKGNVEATMNLLEVVNNYSRDSRVVVSGSAAEYGRVAIEDLPLSEKQLPNPISPYGVSKSWQSTAVRYYAAKGVDVVAGRIFNIVGKGVPVELSIGSFVAELKKIKSGKLPAHISAGNLLPKRDFIDVQDACNGLVSLAKKGRCGEIYNICSGRSISMERILRMMIKYMGLDVEIVIDPNKVKKSDIEDIFGSNQKIESETNWRQTLTIEESIKQVLE